MTVQSSAARVRWGNQQFWRISEFAGLAEAEAFAELVRRGRSHEDAPIEIWVERAVGRRWVRVR